MTNVDNTFRHLSKLETTKARSVTYHTAAYQRVRRQTMKWGKAVRQWVGEKSFLLSRGIWSPMFLPDQQEGKLKAGREWNVF